MSCQKLAHERMKCNHRNSSEIESPRTQFTVVLMPKEEDQEMSFDIWCDLLERELKIALEDVVKIRQADKAEVKDVCYMVRAALVNARHYLREIQDSYRE